MRVRDSINKALKYGNGSVITLLSLTVLPRKCQKRLKIKLLFRLVVLISLATGSIIHYKTGPYQGKQTGETSLFSQLIDCLALGDLLIADRYYCTFAIIALSQVREVPVLFQVHAIKKVDFRRGQRLGAKDHWVEWHKPKRKPVWMTVETYAGLPCTITLREFTVKGLVFVTTLLNATKYPKNGNSHFLQTKMACRARFKSYKNPYGDGTIKMQNP